MNNADDAPDHLRVHRPKVRAERILSQAEFDCVYTSKGKLYVGHQQSVARVGGSLRFEVDDPSEAARRWLKCAVEDLRECLRRVVKSDEQEGGSPT